MDHGKAQGLALHIAKKIAMQANAEHAMARLENSSSPDEFRSVLRDVSAGLSEEKQDELLAYIAENDDWEAYKSRLLSAAEKSRVDQMSPSS